MDRYRYLIVFVLTALLTGPAWAAGESATLKRIAKAGKMTIGYVPDAPPMSFHDDGKVVGYSIDLCRHIAKHVRRELGLAKMKLSFVPLIAPEERLRAVEKGDVDIECGATTVTMSRRKRVDFTLMTYITGGTVLSLKDGSIDTTAGLDGKLVAVIDGTTTESAVKRFQKVNEFDIKLRSIASHEEGMRLLRERKVDAYASDRAMLIGQALRTDEASGFTLAADVFSFEPYALMIARGDTEFRLVADRALAELYRSARIRRLYTDWFSRQGAQMPPIVEAMYEFQAVAD